jgi:peroxiredoxin
MRPDIRVGARFPDSELTDHIGNRRKLSELQGEDPMILVLSRGHFCPKDRRQMRNLVEFYPELKVGYTRIVTVSTDNLVQTNEFRDALGAQWPFLSDPGRKVQKDLDIQGGLGLGLSVVSQLLSQLGGKIEAKSRPGKGSTFEVWLPAHHPVARSGVPSGPDREGLRTLSR